MKGILKTTSYTAMGNINGPKINVMKEIGKITWCMEKVSTHGMTAGNIKVTTYVIKKKDMAYIHGLIKVNTMVIGKIINKMDQPNMIMAKIK